MSDLISRQDAIDAIGDEPEVWMDDDEYAKGMKAQWKYDRKAIEDLPSAERKGTWIRNMDSLIGAIQKPYCSVCGNSAIGNHGFDCIITNFCPNCGADMRGEEE